MEAIESDATNKAIAIVADEHKTNQKFDPATGVLATQLQFATWYLESLRIVLWCTAKHYDYTVYWRLLNTYVLPNNDWLTDT